MLPDETRTEQTRASPRGAGAGVRIPKELGMMNRRLCVASIVAISGLLGSAYAQETTKTVETREQETCKEPVKKETVKKEHVRTESEHVRTGPTLVPSSRAL